MIRWTRRQGSFPNIGVERVPGRTVAIYVARRKDEPIECQPLPPGFARVVAKAIYREMEGAR